MRTSAIARHFCTRDPKMSALIEQLGMEPLAKPLESNHYFFKLCREIIAQQLSGRVAEVITKRFNNLFREHPPKPQHVLEHAEQVYRDVGMSWAKARYVRDLAEKVATGEVRLDHLPALADEEVVLELTKVKGIGRWTAEMFLIFTLGREDVFSFGDLGLKRAMQKLYRLSANASAQRITKIVAKWAPYRSYAALMLWKSLDAR